MFKPQDSLEELEIVLMGAIAEEMVRSIFWNTRIFARKKCVECWKSNNPGKASIPLTDFLVKSNNPSSRQWWNVEVKSSPRPFLRKSVIDEKPELALPNSKVVHVNRNAAPYIRVMTHPFIPNSAGFVEFTTGFDDDLDFRINKRVLNYYESRARTLLMIPSLTRDPALWEKLKDLLSLVREDSPSYETPSS